MVLREVRSTYLQWGPILFELRDQCKRREQGKNRIIQQKA